MKNQSIFFYAIVILFLSGLPLWAQEEHQLQKTMRKRFIDRVELMMGPSLCFNYGNKFIDSYSSNVFTNKRELKYGYYFGLGLYHPIKSRIGLVSLNARLILEYKGANSKFTTAPLDTGATHNLIQTVESDYSYRYITFTLTPTFYFGKNKKWSVLVGGYYSWLKSVDGHVSWTSISKSYNEFSVQSFKGRNIFEINPNGGIMSFGQAPGLSSFQNIDFGAVFGIGYFIPLKKPHGISIQIIDHFGIQDISKQFFPLMTPPEKNHSINLIFSYTINRSYSKL